MYGGRLHVLSTGEHGLEVTGPGAAPDSYSDSQMKETSNSEKKSPV